MSEQRLHPRHAIELDVMLEDLGELPGVENTLAGRTKDLSRGGLCMLAERGVPVSRPVRVRLALVFSVDQFSEQLEIEGKIAWSTPLAGGHQIGIKFEGITSDARSHLDLFMRFLEGGD